MFLILNFLYLGKSLYVRESYCFCYCLGSISTLDYHQRGGPKSVCDANLALESVVTLEVTTMVEGLKLGLGWRLKQHLPLEGLYSFL